MIDQLPRLVVLISGNGSNLQVIINGCQSGELSAKVVLVVSNKAGAFGLKRAETVDIPTEVKEKKKDQDRRDYDKELAQLVARYEPDWVILAGWMRILSSDFLSVFPGRVINLHPALPGSFPGTHAIERAFEAYQHGEVKSTGVMVHLVPDEGVDNGPVLGQEIVPIRPEDKLEDLETRIHACEHKLLVQTLRSLLQKNFFL